MPKHNLRDNLDEELKSYEKSIRPTEVTKAPVGNSDVKIRLRIDSNYKVTGKISGREYLFAGAGSVLDVDERDVEWILTLRRGKGCCGGGGANAIFELAGE